MAAATLAALLLAAAAPQPFVDPLDVAARESALAARSPLQAVAAAGTRLVAVGERGHALWSDDGGRTWAQAGVPVSIDLTAVRFVSPLLGWSAGHGGVVLRTRDGGRSWERQRDDRDAGLDGSMFDVGFVDERTGWAVGAFGLVLRTDDGGVTWTSWRERAENPRQLHLYAIAAGGGALWMAGEQGLLLRLDAAGGRLRAVRTPYAGTFFGLVACRDALVAFGLRGHVVRTGDGGASFRVARAGTGATLTGGTLLPDGRLALVAADGSLLLSGDCGETFERVADAGAGASAVAPAGGRAVVVVGRAGARVERLR